MNRREESSEEEFARMVALGERNLRCIEGMRAWCGKARIERTHQGIYAAITGLPIAGHRLTCPEAHGSESMNFACITEEFLSQNCRNCQVREPNGSEDWARNELARISQQEEVQRTHEIAEITRIKNLQARLVKESEAIQNTMGDQSKSLIALFRGILSEDSDKRTENGRNLERAAEIAPELFSSDFVALVAEAAMEKSLEREILPVCARLAGASASADLALERVAVHLIVNREQSEQGAKILIRLKKRTAESSAEAICESLLLKGKHAAPFGGWHTGRPTHSNIAQVLAQCSDEAPAHFLKTVQRLLKSGNDAIRGRTCAALHEVQRLRPSIVAGFLTDLLSSLDKKESGRARASASSQVVKILQEAFQVDAVAVSKALKTKFKTSRPAVQSDLIKVCRHHLLRRDSSDVDTLNDHKASATEGAVECLSEWLISPDADLEARVSVAESLSVGCKYSPTFFLGRIDEFIGHLALSVDSEPTVPRHVDIIVPGAPVEPQQASMKKLLTGQHWGMYKTHLQECVSALGRNEPELGFKAVYQCLTATDANLSSTFKGTLLEIIGSLADDFTRRAEALPLLMTSMMDYRQDVGYYSQWVRSRGVSALRDSFRSSAKGPPENVIDAILILLRDPLVVVHKATIKLIADCPEWFVAERQKDAFGLLLRHLDVYRAEPFELESIAIAMIELAKGSAALSTQSVKSVCSLLPSGQSLVDENVVEILIRQVPPESSDAPAVVKSLMRVLSRSGRDRYNSYEHSRRSSFFHWLRRVPNDIAIDLRTEILQAGVAIAEADHWECLNVCDVLSRNLLYAEESTVLNAALKSIPDEFKSQEIRRNLYNLRLIASANAGLLDGDRDTAKACFEKTMGLDVFI